MDPATERLLTLSQSYLLQLERLRSIAPAEVGVWTTALSQQRDQIVAAVLDAQGSRRATRTSAA